MVYEVDNEYYRKCDECGDIRKIQKQSYNKNIHKKINLCNSCSQKGERNHRYNKPPWNKGLTKNTDERVKAYGLSCSLTKHGYEPWNKGKSYEELKGKEWADSFKKNSSNLRKGKPNYKRRKDYNKSKPLSYFRKMCRVPLYSAWTRKILERDNFRCVYCGYNKDLEVHHLRSFSSIVKKVAKELNIDLNDYKELTEFEYNSLREAIVNEHKLEDGITVCDECHKGIDERRRRFHVAKVS